MEKHSRVTFATRSDCQTAVIKVGAHATTTPKTYCLPQTINGAGIQNAAAVDHVLAHHAVFDYICGCTCNMPTEGGRVVKSDDSE